MNQLKRKPLLNRKETQTLLTTLKVTSVAGVLSLTLAGWGLLAQLDATPAQAAFTQQAAQVAALPESSTKIVNSKVLPTPAPTAPPRIKLNIVQWVQDMQGNAVAVVRDRRGTLWYVLGSDVPRIEQGLAPQVQPQPVQMVTHSRAS
jgi:hypothetical protein